MADMLCEDFGHFGVRFQRVSLDPVQLLGDNGTWHEQESAAGLLWHHNPDATKRILLMIHYDTVYPTTTTPSKCVLQENRLIGPGTADAKGGIAVIAMAIEAMLRYEVAPNVGVTVFLNPDEEIGSSGSLATMRRLADLCDWGLVFEPSLPDGALVAARKGSGNFAITVEGRSAHAGRNPDDGRNAIVHLCRVIAECAALHQPENGILVNIGKIHGGGPLNQVPDFATSQMNVRVQDNDAMKIIDESLIEITERFSLDGYHVNSCGGFHSPPKLRNQSLIDMQKRVEKAASSVGRSISWRDTGGSCDGSKLAAFGLPNIDTMGICGNHLHDSREYCDVKTLVSSATTVLSAIAEYEKTN